MSTPSPSFLLRERERVLLLAILVLSLAVRLAHLVTILGTAYPKFPLVFDQSDMYAFREWAQTILAGDWLGRDTYHPAFEWMKNIAPMETWYRWWGGKAIFQHAPLYPYLVAGLLALSRKSLGFVMAVQLVLGAFQPVVVFWLGRRLFDGRVGLVAAALTAVYGPFIFHEGTLLRDWLPPILEPLALVALLRAQESGRGRDWSLAGAVLGVALLTREGVILFLPAALLWLVCGNRHGLATLGRRVAPFVLGFALALSPLVARNVAVGASALSLSNRAGEAFIVGNAADGFPIGLFDPPSKKGIMERADGRIGRVILETFKTYHGNWRGFLAFQALRLRAFVDPLEVPNNVSFYYGREISPVLRLTLTYGIVFPLGLAGLAISLQSWRRYLLLILYGLCTTAGLLGTTIIARYRITIAPVLIVYSAVGLVWLWDAVRQRRAVRGVTYGMLVLAFAFLQHSVLALAFLRDQPAIAIYPVEYLVAADIYVHEGRPDRAVAEIERLEARAAERPSFAEVARRASLYAGDYGTLWANQLLAEGKTDQAKRQVERIEAAYESHPELIYPSYNLGLLYLKLGDVTKARASFERFVARAPAGVPAERVRRLLAEMDR